MSNAEYPKPAAEIVGILIEIFQHQHRDEIVRLLTNSHAYFDEPVFDNWNGGTNTWTLRLEVPVSLFASVRQRIDAIKEEIAGNFDIFKDLYTNDFLNAVSITPVLPIAGQRAALPNADVHRLWLANTFRLFLSHVSSQKVEIATLKKHLSMYGIDAFVAHDDIEPSREWQAEIELALRSMHALAACITPDFHNSRWTDQEMGWALGREVLVLPIRLGADPYGFAGKVQAVTGTLAKPKPLADLIVRALLRHSQTHSEIRKSLVAAFSHPESFEAAKILQGHFDEIDDLSDEEKASLRKACIEDSQVKGAWGVVDAIYRKIGKSPVRM
jgi:hypothetical protein